MSTEKLPTPEQHELLKRWCRWFDFTPAALKRVMAKVNKLPSPASAAHFKIEVVPGMDRADFGRVSLERSPTLTLGLGVSGGYWGSGIYTTIDASKPDSVATLIRDYADRIEHTKEALAKERILNKHRKADRDTKVRDYTAAVIGLRAIADSITKKALKATDKEDED